MTPTNDFSQHAKESALWALAYQNPEFQQFYEYYHGEI